MPLNQYILRNGLSAEQNLKSPRNHIITETGVGLVLTDDLRGGVLGKEHDVVAIREPQMQYFEDWITDTDQEPEKMDTRDRDHMMTGTFFEQFANMTEEESVKSKPDFMNYASDVMDALRYGTQFYTHRRKENGFRNSIRT